MYYRTCKISGGKILSGYKNISVDKSVNKYGGALDSKVDKLQEQLSKVRLEPVKQKLKNIKISF